MFKTFILRVVETISTEDPDINNPIAAEQTGQRMGCLLSMCNLKASMYLLRCENLLQPKLRPSFLTSFVYYSEFHFPTAAIASHAWHWNVHYKFFWCIGEVQWSACNLGDCLYFQLKEFSQLQQRKSSITPSHWCNTDRTSFVLKWLNKINCRKNSSFLKKDL